MRVTKAVSTVREIHTLHIEGGEVRPLSYTRQGRVYRVDRVVVAKKDGIFSSVALSGPVLKKDGTDGLNRHEEHLYGGLPEWLTGLLKGLAAPTTVITLPADLINANQGR